MQAGDRDRCLRLGQMSHARRQTEPIRARYGLLLPPTIEIYIAASIRAGTVSPALTEGIAGVRSSVIRRIDIDIRWPLWRVKNPTTA
ncbi:hypothetical protein SADO_06287 [Salinisphaera dokdonensis CL-ES53]|uniref:Uncharacterized protein n=1 Tax=Salinisphaera dokdonensis CL-ES53 TaxID=1304272 RepID=A0ABV2AYY7_9GAMM